MTSQILLSTAAQLPAGYSLHSAASRPEMYGTLFDPNHAMSSLWPQFVTSTPTALQYWDKLSLIPYFAQFQLIILANESVTQRESVVACANSIPVFCPLDDLPDGGWDAILQKGMDDFHQDKSSPNLLSALGVTVSREHRRLGLAELLIQALRDLARQRRFEWLVVPLRPTRKSEHPFADLAEYLTWKSDRGSSGLAPEPDQIYDPWLRKHVMLGGKLLKIAPKSMSVEASGQQWTQWTGCDLSEMAKERHVRPKVTATGCEFVELPIPGALVPVRYYPAEDMASYVEPNIWVVHSLL